MSSKESVLLDSPAPTKRQRKRPVGRLSAVGGELGEKLRAERLLRKWTLDIASQKTGVARSTLSKIENGIMSPTYDMLQRIAAGLSVDLAHIFGNHEESSVTGRRTITRNGEGIMLESGNYIHEFLATELSKKKFLPFRTVITGTDIHQFGELAQHSGEEFFYVLSGEVELHTEHYAPARLKTGDSAYFDSRMKHGLISIGDKEASILWICSDKVADSHDM